MPWLKDGRKHGPVDTPGLKRLARVGDLHPADMIWRKGLPDWAPASQAKGLFKPAMASAPTGDVPQASTAGQAIPNVESAATPARTKEVLHAQGATAPTDAILRRAMYFRGYKRGIKGVLGAVGVGFIVLLGLWAFDGRMGTNEQAEVTRLRAEMEAMKTKPGSVVITVTWKSSDFVGSRPDTDAVVVLVPEYPEGKLANCLAPGFPKLMYMDELASKGAYLETAGGDGKAIFNQVKPGKYVAVIVSRNTFQSIEFNRGEVSLLEKYFENPSTGTHSVTRVKIEVVPGERFEKSHDFGMTSW